MLSPLRIVPFIQIDPKQYLDLKDGGSGGGDDDDDGSDKTMLI